MTRFLSIVIIFLLSFFGLHAQISLSSDELFKNARNEAFENKNYAKAKELAYQALSISPSYADIDIFLGRVYSWNDEYDSAKLHFTKVLTVNPNNEDACIAYTDLEYWNDHFQSALDVCNSGLKNYPGSSELLIRKGKILFQLKNYHDANAIADELLKIKNDNKDVISLKEKIKDALAVNKLSISYDYSAFDKQYSDPWHLASIAYTRYLKNVSVIARVNYANRFNTNGVQAEVDAYPHISKTFYSYLNLGYSDNLSVFPKYRAGFSLYANLPRSFEAEAGIRYLYFSSPVNIYTAYIGKYYKSFLFGLRTYITPSYGGLSQSYIASARYYFKGADDYLAITAGTGISPDDNNQNIQINNKQIRLTSKKISADFSHTFFKHTIFSCSTSLINQEYLPSTRGNQFDFSIGIAQRF